MRVFKILLCVTLVLALLTGCSIEMVSMPDLPKIELGKSQLAGVVEHVNGRTCRVRLTEGDSHFDADEIIQLTYTNLVGSKSVNVGQDVRFEYDYTSQVAEYLGSPHITVNQVHVG